jgi:hypothetical protein
VIAEMTWWSYILELLSLGLLAFTIGLTAFRAGRHPDVKPFSLLAGGGGAVIASFFVVLLSPARPVGAVITVLLLLGAAGGVFLGSRAKFEVRGGGLKSAQGIWYLVVWSSLVFLSSLLLVSGSGLAKAGVSIMLISSLAVAGYTYCLYMRYALSARQ